MDRFNHDRRHVLCLINTDTSNIYQWYSSSFNFTDDRTNCFTTVELFSFNTCPSYPRVYLFWTQNFKIFHTPILLLGSITILIISPILLISFAILLLRSEYPSKSLSFLNFCIFNHLTYIPLFFSNTRYNSSTSRVTESFDWNKIKFSASLKNTSLMENRNYNLRTIRTFVSFSFFPSL